MDDEKDKKNPGGPLSWKSNQSLQDYLDYRQMYLIRDGITLYGTRIAHPCSKATQHNLVTI